MKRELQLFVDKYIKSINSDNAAIFAGAGLSVASGLVNWKELLREIANELQLDIDKEDDLISLAQFYENEKGGRGSINSQLIDEFTKDVALNDNHKIISSLPIRTFWTTNYDNLIEKSLEAEGKSVDKKICVENLATNKPRRDAVVYKMHGDISLPHDAVLTKDDYDCYNEKRQLYTTSLQGDLISKTFLFIGFSFEDPNLDYILSRIKILLGPNRREHYCFFRKVQALNYGGDTDDYRYAKIKQELRIKDLKRFGIQSLLVDDYCEITEVLKLIQTKIKRQSIFISGAAHDYGILGKERTEKLLYDLASTLSKKNYKIISGFGLGVGSSVINGVLSYVYQSQKRHLDDYLISRPFPQNINDPEERKSLWQKYREDMISESGIAIFFLGNKKVKDELINSDGLIEEFNIAISQGVKVIPVGLSGFVSRELWEKVIKDTNNYYPDNPELIESITTLGEQTLSDTEIINNIIKSINLLQEQV